jgi:hypothetical protein
MDSVLAHSCRDANWPDIFVVFGLQPCHGGHSAQRAVEDGSS